MIIARKLTTILAVASFAVALSLPLTTSAEPGSSAAKMTATNAAPPQARERHPEIRDAMKLLADAQNHLKHAAEDFGGHRVKAMQHIDEAMEELRAALATDKH